MLRAAFPEFLNCSIPSRRIKKVFTFTPMRSRSHVISSKSPRRVMSELGGWP